MDPFNVFQYDEYSQLMDCGNVGFGVEKDGFWFFINVIQKCEKQGYR